MHRPITAAEKALLKRISIGLYLLEPERNGTQWRLVAVLGKPPLFHVTRKTVDSCIVEGFIERGEKSRWRLTARGRAQLEVSTFVRAFCDTAAVTT